MKRLRSSDLRRLVASSPTWSKCSHRRGGSKAKLLIRMGYSPHDPQRLEADLRAQHLPVEVDQVVDTEYGPRYEILAPLSGPAGLTIPFRSVWQIDTGTDVPRLITMIPE